MPLTAYGFPSAVKSAVALTAGTKPLFTVLGGRIVLISLFGTITTGVGAGAAVLTLNSNPDTGADSPLSIASASVATLGVGTLISITGAVGSAPAFSVGQGAIASMTTPLIIQPGAIELIVAVGDGTGIMTWYADWRPIDPGASLLVA